MTTEKEIKKSSVIKVPRKELLDSLTTLRINIPQVDMAEISKYTIFQNGRIHAYNDMAGMTVPFDPAMGDCAVDSSLLFDFVRSSPDRELLMGIKDGALRIQGASKVGDDIVMAELAVRDDIIYPQGLVEPNPDDYTRLPDTFATALLYTAFACDEDSAVSSRIVLKDGYAYSRGRFAVCEFYMGDEAVELVTDPMFISPACVGFVNRDAPKKYLNKNGWLHLMNENCIVYSQRSRADENYPFEAIQDMLTEPTSPSFRFPASMEEILKRCAPFSGHTARIRKVSIRISEGLMTLKANRSDGSRFLEKAKAADSEAIIDFNINLKAITDVVGLADKYKSDGYRLLGYGTNFRVMTALEGRDDD